jgi:hypothetical protein
MYVEINVSLLQYNDSMHMEILLFPSTELGLQQALQKAIVIMVLSLLLIFCSDILEASMAANDFLPRDPQVYESKE